VKVNIEHDHIEIEASVDAVDRTGVEVKALPLWESAPKGRDIVARVQGREAAAAPGSVQT